MADEQPEEPNAEAGDDSPVDDPAEAGPESPASASAEPPSEALARAEAAFERGDYAEVRALATPLAAGSGARAEAAAELLRRTSIDPAQIGILLACLLFFVFIVWKYVF